MKRASPVELRRALDAANAMVQGGILFVPVPVLDPIDHARLAAMADQRIGEMLKEAEVREAKP